MVLVVPRRETALYQYLKRSMAPLPEIEVVLDRRGAGEPPAGAPATERRRHGVAAVRRILMCGLFPGAPPSPPAGPEPAPIAQDPEPPPCQSRKGEAPPTPPPAPRTLLWPGLRLEDLG
jgi:hypothetical protein